MLTQRLEIIPIEGMPLVKELDDLPKLILTILQSSQQKAMPGDVLIVSHSIVSVAEGRVFEIRAIDVSDRARMIAEKTGQEPEKVELALREADKIIRESPVLITQTRQGIITDYSGVDSSNAPSGKFIALPEDPDESANKLHAMLSESFGFHLPVIICDTQGRPWRKGATNLAIGVAGISPLVDNKGRKDLYGRELQSSLVCIADELASAAELVMGQADEGIPIVLIRGVEYERRKGLASDILRSRNKNLFL
ncbi:MAG: coenzyme F420-0:L-glutamate ligase [Candidatus Thorarchaeota archaeon]